MSEQTGAQAGGFEFDVFISYAKTDPDRQFARRLYHRLCSAGLKVAMDDANLNAGEHRVAGQSRMVENSRKTVAVISKAYLASGFCRSQALSSLYLGMEDRASRVIPVALEAEIPTDLPPWLEELALIPWHEEAVLASRWERLMRALLSSGQPHPPTSESCRRNCHASLPMPVQVTNITGDGNMSVQAWNSQVNFFEAPRLVIQPVPPRAIDLASCSEVELLLPAGLASELVARDQELLALQEWLRGEAQISVAVLCGPMGSGKTALAHELIRRVGSMAQTWERVGCIDPSHLRSIPQHQLQHTWGDCTSAFVFVDYAAEVGVALRDWFWNVLSVTTGRFRLLLADRAANPEAGWYSVFLDAWKRHSYSQHRVIEQPVVIPLAPITDPRARRHLISIGARVAPATRGEFGPVESGLTDSCVEGSISLPRELILKGMFQADGDPGCVRQRTLSAAVHLADRELSRILRHPEIQGFGEREHLCTFAAAQTVLLGTVQPRQVDQFTQDCAAMLGPHYQQGIVPVQMALRDLLPMKDGGLSTLECRWVAEALLLRLFFGRNSFSTEVVTRALGWARTQAPHRAQPFWDRMVEDFGWTTSPLRELAESAKRLGSSGE